MSLQKKTLVSLVLFGVLFVAVFAGVNLFRAEERARERAKQTAQTLVDRTVQMFMVSTVEFEKQWEAAKTQQEKERVLANWSASFSAVDQAVAHDHGKDTARIRLVGDQKVLGVAPLGHQTTRIENDFERDSLQKLKSGVSAIETYDEDYLRLSLPLPSRVHVGCASCHSAYEYGIGAKVNSEVLLGSINAYVPLREAKEAAYRDTAVSSIPVIVLLVIGIAALLVLTRKAIIAPVHDLSGKLTATAEELSVVADSLNGTSERLSSSSSQQEASVQETVKTLGGIASVVQRNQEVSEKAGRLADQSFAAVQEGRTVVSEMLESVVGIRTGNEEVRAEVESGNARILEVVELINRISEKAKVINDIVFQTKLLAFNASVEAARAGEAGRGFAVVAEEVGNLAQMSGRSAMEIDELLRDSVAQVRSIISETQEGVGGRIHAGQARIEAGLKVAEHCESIFKNIESQISELNVLSRQVVESSLEQNQGVGRISSEMGELGETSRGGTELAHQSRELSEALTRQARAIQNVIAEIREQFDGKSDRHAS